MPIQDYKKEDAVGFGDSIGNLINAIRGDGVSAARLQELIGVLTAGASAVNEMKDVPEAAAEHILGGTAISLGDASLKRALEAEAAGE